MMRLNDADRAWLLELRATRPTWAAVRLRALTSTSIDWHDGHLVDVIDRLARVELAVAKARAA